MREEHLEPTPWRSQLRTRCNRQAELVQQSANDRTLLGLKAGQAPKRLARRLVLAPARVEVELQAGMEAEQEPARAPGLLQQERKYSAVAKTSRARRSATIGVF